MTMYRMWFPVFASACLMVSSLCLAAPEGEDYWATYASWQKAAHDIAIQVEAESIDAMNKKRPAVVMPIYEKGYVYYLESLKKGKEIDPIRDSVYHSILAFRTQYSILGHEVEKMEKELRTFWATQYKPNRTGDFLLLFNRYMEEKKHRDALRIAEECYRDYGWTWEARDWLERIIAVLAVLPEMKDQLVVRVEEYHDKHMTQLGSYSTLSAGLSYLYADGEYDQAARIVESCLVAYNGCDWEPQFLLQAVMIHTARIDAPAKEKEDAKPGSKGATVPTKAAAVPPKAAAMPSKPATGMAKPLAQGAGETFNSSRPTRIPVAPLRPASEINSIECALAAVKRCADVYPHEPQSAEAILKYLHWALADGRDPAIRDEAGQLVQKYLTANKSTPNWGLLYQAGKSWVDKGDPMWLALSGGFDPYVVTESNRTEQLKVVMDIPATNRLPLATALSEFVIANPDTVQARKAFASLTSMVLVGGWKNDLNEITVMATNTLSKSFPASPMYQWQQLAALSMSGILPESTEIANALIAEAKTPIQKERAYYLNHYRYIQSGGYNIPAFKLWVKNFKDSYHVPSQLAILTQRACYSQKMEDASEACDAAACKELGNSLIMSSQLGANIWQWMRYARDKEIKEEEAGKAAGKRKGTKVLEREALMNANAQANFIDEVQADKTDLGFFYYDATVWGDLIDFKTKRGMSAKQILRQKEYRGSYYYYYAKAYEKDKEKK